MAILRPGGDETSGENTSFVDGIAQRAFEKTVFGFLKLHSVFRSISGTIVDFTERVLEDKNPSLPVMLEQDIKDVFTRLNGLCDHFHATYIQDADKYKVSDRLQIYQSLSGEVEGAMEIIRGWDDESLKGRGKLNEFLSCLDNILQKISEIGEVYSENDGIGHSSNLLRIKHNLENLKFRFMLEFNL